MSAFECRYCGECCKIYNISILPEEAEKIASLLEIPLEEFLERHCQMLIHLFSSNYKTNPLVQFSGDFPKSIYRKLQKKIVLVPQYFLVLPAIALKKPCSFYSGKCEIHPARPGACKAFPFVTLNREASLQDLQERYKFCKGLQEMKEELNEEYFKAKEIHFKETHEYFEKVKKEGFEKVWNYVPGKGILLYKDLLICGINEKEIKRFISPFTFKGEKPIN